jgi:hypothetical protein
MRATGCKTALQRRCDAYDVLAGHSPLRRFVYQKSWDCLPNVAESAPINHVKKVSRETHRNLEGAVGKDPEGSQAHSHTRVAA